MKIGYLYYKFSPPEGGAAIHGYYLAKELAACGYHLMKLNGKKDPFTKKLGNPVTGFIRMLAECDLIYARMDYFLKPRNLLAWLAMLSGKKVIVELNSPSDELYLHGKSASYIRRADRIMARILRRAATVVVVSDPIQEYCREALQLDNVVVVENGANRFETDMENISPNIVQSIAEIKKKWPKIVVWPGSVNKMQNLEALRNLAARAEKKAAFVLIAHEEPGETLQEFQEKNIVVWKNTERAAVEYIISQADAGIALYDDYPWSRWGFYNSSLKIFEYLSNGLIAISNRQGTAIQQKNPNFRYAGNFDEMLTFIDEKPVAVTTDNQIRTWKHVAGEISHLIQRAVRD